MEISYIYGNVLVDLPGSRTTTAPFRSSFLPSRLSTAVTPLHSQSTELVGILHKWKSSQKRKSCLIRLTINTSLFISTIPYFTLFSGINSFFFFSLLQTTKLNLKRLTTLQQPWTNWLAPTMWTLINAKTGSEELLGTKILSTTWS